MTTQDRAGLREAAWCGDRNPHRSHQGPPRCKGVSYREAGILRAALAAPVAVDVETGPWPDCLRCRERHVREGHARLPEPEGADHDR